MQTLDDQTFSAVTSSVFLTTLVVPLLVRLIYDDSRKYGGYQKRNIHSADNAEFKVLVCAHRPDDAMATIKLLEASNLTKESPITIYALHLLELVGRATPLLINHQLGQKSSTSGGSRSQQIIKSFNFFEQQHSGSVTTHAFTSISLSKFMHEDICSLAFEKSAFLIVLPFHRKWNFQGKIVLENKVWQGINRQVLRMAPCSVGILVDRRKIQSSICVPPVTLPYRVGVIFLGGDDDREALAYAKRMAKNPEIFLTVVRFSAYIGLGEDSWETIIDAEVLKEMRMALSQAGNVRFLEEKMKDGVEFALKIHSMEESYDLIIVGRRHNMDSPLLAGLTQWMELPELGPVGDILGSQEINRPVSVLVVQQQLHVKIK